MEYLSTKMLTNFKQKWYSHYGGGMGFFIDVRTVEKACSFHRQRHKEVGSFYGAAGKTCRRFQNI